ncbi:putative iron/ascorbate oxidoreductase [Smittium mucronatum]|uniref:Putative iron/ascorbate oxidoreductase n=1 Tax=Smittium mucronatum TaxID=133383 RepID=A0A1R0GUQ1_9FUNG|nr:putative iron/ascorbate oxidoreductase [Smittium mucronatum]
MTNSSDFTIIPVLDLNLLQSGNQDQLLDELRSALLDVGFFYVKNHGVAQWPSDEAVPGFRQTYIQLLASYKKLALQLIELIALSLGLPKDTLYQYFEKDQQNRAKVIKYPSVNELDPNDGNQGVGPHKDGAFLLTILYQANDLPGLQVQNHSGEWIDASPIPETFVINIGTGLEMLTGGLAVATTHRVLNPPPGRGPRYSIPYFFSFRLDKPFKPLELPEKFKLLEPKEAVSDAFYEEKESFMNNLSSVFLRNRITSHPDVGFKHYPKLAQEYGVDANTKF